MVDREIRILENVRHTHIVNLLDSGKDGRIVKVGGSEIIGLKYIMMEYVNGGLMFDVIKSLKACGEDGGRYFMHQMLDVLEHLQSFAVCHRDLKLENILVDDQMNIKIADFGFATST